MSQFLPHLLHGLLLIIEPFQLLDVSLQRSWRFSPQCGSSDPRVPGSPDPFKLEFLCGSPDPLRIPGSLQIEFFYGSPDPAKPLNFALYERIPGSLLTDPRIPPCGSSDPLRIPGSRLRIPDPLADPRFPLKLAGSFNGSPTNPNQIVIERPYSTIKCTHENTVWQKRNFLCFGRVSLFST